MSTLRIGTLIVATSTMLLLVLAYVLEGVAHKDLVPEPVALLMSVATIIAWIGFFCAYCRDSAIAAISDRIDAAGTRTVNSVVPNTNRALGVVLDTIHQAVAEAEQRGANDARVDTLAHLGVMPPVDPVRSTGHRLGVVDN